MRILLIDHDENTAKSLQSYASELGIEIDHKNNGQEGYRCITFYDYNLIMVNTHSKEISGYEILNRVLANKLRIPVVLISDQDTKHENILEGLSSGADEYITKPFNAEQVIARMKIIIRRSMGHADSIINFDKVSINLDTRTILVNGKHVTLTNKEYAIFELLIMRKGSVLTKEMFLSHLYRGLDEPEMKIIDVFVCKLRKKLAKYSGNDYIQTVWGRGYMLKDFEFTKPKKHNIYGSETESSESETTKEEAAPAPAA